MPDDLDLALRVRADVGQAQKQLRALQASIGQSTEAVARANSRQADAAETAARAARALAQAQEKAARDSTQAARAAVEKARADRDAAAGALRAARAETQAASARARSARTAYQLAQSLDTQTTAQTRANAATRAGVKSRARSAAQIQNAAFQVQDFAVQVAAGTSALTAFGQNAPQLLGGFGALGAILGAVVAVALPLAGVMLNLGDTTEDAAEAIDRLAEATDRLRALERIRSDADALADAYGRASAQARALVAAQAELARRQATTALNERIAELADAFDAGDVAGAVATRPAQDAEKELLSLVQKARAIFADADFGIEINIENEDELQNLVNILRKGDIQNVAEQINATLETTTKLIALRLGDTFQTIEDEIAALNYPIESALAESIKSLSEQIGLTEEEARRLIDAFGELRGAAGVDAQLNALGKMRAILTGIRADTNDLTEEQEAALDALTKGLFEAEEQALKLSAAGETIAPGIDDAAAAARGLANELSRALRSLAGLQSRAENRLRRARIGIDFADNPEELRRQLRFQAQREVVEPVRRRLADEGLSIAEIAAATQSLDEQAGAAFDAEQAAIEAETALRGLGRTGSGAGRAATKEIDRLSEAQRKAAEEARALETATHDALRAYADDALEVRDDVAEAWTGGFRGLEDALVGFVTTGKASFRDLANSILADLARIAIRQNIVGPLADALAGVFGGFGGGAPTTSLRPRARPFHSGGVPTAPDTPGLAPGEVPALLLRGEAVLTSSQSRALLGLNRAAQERDRAMAILRSAARYHAGGVAGLPGGNTIPDAAGGGLTGAARPMNVSVEVTNAGTPQRVENAGAHLDVRGLVVSLFLDDLSSGGPMARGIQNIVPGTRL
ncbi:phage tail tape measure C-terminal domain-containing protein [Tateyamaria sp.]|uniref:phage tail tape measure C-terminal domain-containing protein n=1 Tax=Tateyamaria sp. TaxID=1929288 RepID=UPI003B215052